MVIFNHNSRFAILAKFLVVCSLVLLGTGASCRAAGVHAELDRASVPAGNGAVMTLRISGKAARPEIPEVENLIVQSRGESQKMRTFNGNVTVTSIYTYVVGSRTPGDYEIPPIEVILDGEKQSSQPLKLRVLDSTAVQPPAVPDAEEEGSPGTEPVPEKPENQFGFLTVEFSDSERAHAYVGEIAPVRIKAWLPSGAQAQLRSAIQPEAKGFTLHNVSEYPQQTQEVRDGKRYTVITWFGGISATKSGKLPASLSVDATVAVPEKAKEKPRRRRGGAVDDPFFDSIFDRSNWQMVQKDVTLKSVDQEIEVRPLPTEGKPDDFTGAVGTFKFDAVDVPGDWKTGEPQQISARLSGSGNFALMKAPNLSPPSAWKSYPGKEEFAAGDDASFAGKKTFQFSAVPRKGGEQDVGLSFSYFDPEAAAYKTIIGGQKKIHVEGNDMQEDEPEVAQAPAEPLKKPGGLVAQHASLKPAATLVPLASRFAFVEILTASGAMVLAGGVLALIRIRRTDPLRLSRVAMEAATRRALEAAGSANDVPGFFAAARLAIQQRLGVIWNQPPQAITSAEVDARISPDSPVVRFFREADRCEYSSHGSGEIRPEWRSLLNEALASLTLSAR